MLVKCVFAYVFFYNQGQLVLCTFKACILKPHVDLLSDDLLYCHDVSFEGVCTYCLRPVTFCALCLSKGRMQRHFNHLRLAWHQMLSSLLSRTGCPEHA